MDAFARSYFFRIFVVVLGVFELLWLTTKLNCLLKASEILLGFDKYLPLKQIAWLLLDLLFPPFIALMSLKSLEKFCRLSSSSSFHTIFLLCACCSLS